MNAINITLNIVSYIVLFGFSLVFGLLDRPAAMGLAIVAGSLGLAFLNIDKIKRFKGAGFEAEMQEKIEAIIEKETETEYNETIGIYGFNIEDYVTDEKSQKVIRALFNPTYTWRYVEGISKESDLPMAEASEALNRLLSNSLVSSTKGDHGTLWCLTAIGRNVLRNIETE